MAGRCPSLALGLMLAVVPARELSAGQLRAPGSGIPLPSVQAAPDRLERLEAWLKASARHTPGENDDALQEIAGWSNDRLKEIWVDTNVLVRVMRNVRNASGSYTLRSGGPKSSTVQVRYSPEQSHRIRVLACAAGGLLDDADCMALHVESELDPDLRRLAALARASNQRGDRNYILRRGALLHADVLVLAEDAMPVRSRAAPSTKTSGVGPERFRMDISDGREVDLTLSAVHWDIARMLLDLVVPQGGDRAEPSADDMVRQWYCATAAWMQLREDHDRLHLDHARQLFPGDPELMLLAAFQHETFAGAPVQAAIRSAILPAGVVVDVASDRVELREAERLFQRALEMRPDHAEGRMHHGRVLALLGRHAEAIVELRRAAAALSDPRLEYYARLFVGAEEEAIGNRDAAREAYERAASLAPMAQSPLLALSQLARHDGDRPGALRALDRLFALADDSRSEDDDPWWSYYISQARDADDRLDAMQAPFRSERLQ